MKSYSAEETAVINAPAPHVYGIIADYNEGHQAILPRDYFDEMLVTKGGYGEGTEIIVKMSVLGVKAKYDMLVTEPEPGRIIQEADAKAGAVTTFTIEPLTDSKRCRVTIRTETVQKSGLQGWIEKQINPRITRRVFREELAILNRVASGTAQPIA